ncbi:MAG: 23S rRNA (adenine(2503)-C(2))-methyltransferase RlmN [Nitrospirota bacterium]
MHSASSTFINLAALSKAELAALAAGWGWPRYRTAQLWQWLYRQRATSFAQMTNLSAPIREQLAERAAIDWPRVARRQIAQDGTRKLLIELADGRRIESVLIPDEGRLTLCLSTQVGCTLDCGFCLTGTMGLARNLKAYEMVGQWHAAQQELEDHPDGLPRRLTNLVFMGMGEPLANLAQLAEALTRLTDPHGIAFPPRRITVSTAGLAPQIAELGRFRPEVNLAVSLNAADDATRAKIMPLAARYSIDELLAACRAYPLGPRRFITFEYVLLDHINDSEEDARRLARLLRGLRAKVNLIPWNPFPGAPYGRPADARVLRFQTILVDHHIPTYIRKSKGRDILAACGQLHSAQEAPVTIAAG